MSALAQAQAHHRSLQQIRRVWATLFLVLAILGFVVLAGGLSAIWATRVDAAPRAPSWCCTLTACDGFALTAHSVARQNGAFVLCTVEPPAWCKPYYTKIINRYTFPEDRIKAANCKAWRRAASDQWAAHRAEWRRHELKGN